MAGSCLRPFDHVRPADQFEGDEVRQPAVEFERAVPPACHVCICGCARAFAAGHLGQLGEREDEEIFPFLGDDRDMVRATGRQDFRGRLVPAFSTCLPALVWATTSSSGYDEPVSGTRGETIRRLGSWTK